MFGSCAFCVVLPFGAGARSVRRSSALALATHAFHVQVAAAHSPGRGYFCPRGDDNDDDSNATLVDCNFLGNRAQSGGAIHVSSGSVVQVEACDLIENSAAVSGGAMQIEGGRVQLLDRALSTLPRKARCSTRFQHRQPDTCSSARVTRSNSSQAPRMPRSLTSAPRVSLVARHRKSSLVPHVRGRGEARRRLLSTPCSCMSELICMCVSRCDSPAGKLCGPATIEPQSCTRGHYVSGHGQPNPRALIQTPLHHCSHV